MIKYKDIYLEHYGLYTCDFIECEADKCHIPAVDIHHIIFKSLGGKDNIDNLIALCRRCHNLAHDKPAFNAILKELKIKEFEQWN